MPIRVDALLVQVRREVVDVVVVPHVLVAVGDHRAAPVPPSVADDVHLAGQEGVGRAHDRADVEVVLPVLDGHVEVVAPGVEVGDDRLHRPVAVAVDHVAPVALGEQLARRTAPRRAAAPPTDRRRPPRARAASGRTAPAARSGLSQPTRRRPATGASQDAPGYARPSDQPPAVRDRLDGPQLAPRPVRAWFFWVCLVIVVVECGLFFPFLPGDTLLFAMGLFIASARRHRARPRRSTCSVAHRAAHASRRSLGNVLGYEIGRWIGPPLYERDGRILKRKYFDQTTRLLRQARQQGAGDRPVRAVRAHLHHRGRRRHPDGAAAASSSGAPSARCCWVAQHHPARLLPRPRLPGPAARTSTRRSW